ncbi:putative inorganic phosphate cotransporter isoform X1 [Vanessa cardui]|uniref:putative inorganic phosphate cotransporter isoform X1 n=1 Tax=Vanessa cardui TaxID=171605 RepID=UPI001F12F982|nr:putative inorganic phosphate cotransporter isoform X1 [Vanessa cardui]
MDVEFLRHKYEDSHDGVITRSKFKIGDRHLQIIYMIICSLSMGLLRGSNGIAILAITDHTRSNNTIFQIHNWDRRIQGTILSSFFFGYALILVPAEIYLKQVGDKLILTAILLINGGLAAAMPTVVNKGGWIAVCNAEFLMGMTQACLTPINHQLISNWLPPSERRLFGSFVQGGILLGTIVALPLSGLMSQARLGWELIFYAQAMLTLSMGAVWALLTASTPDQHHAIGDAEKEFIKEALACYKKKKLRKPWRRIMESKAFWAIASAHSAATATFIFFLVEIPAFLYSINSSIKTSSWQTALPLASMWAVYILTAPTIDIIYRVGYADYLFDIKYYRKIINCLGTFGIVIGLTIVPNLVSNWNHWGVVILMGTLSLLGLQFSGFLRNLNDMTQNHAGTLITISSAVSSLVGALTPLVSGLIVGNDSTDVKRWRILFFTLAAFYFVCNVIYSAFASSDRQDWDDDGKQKFGYSNDVTNLELEELSERKVAKNETEDITEF